jgi:hypothetical protein
MDAAEKSIQRLNTKTIKLFAEQCILIMIHVIADLPTRRQRIASAVRQPLAGTASENCFLFIIPCTTSQPAERAKNVHEGRRPQSSLHRGL